MKLSGLVVVTAVFLVSPVSAQSGPSYDISPSMTGELYAIQEAAAAKDQVRILSSLVTAERQAVTPDDLFVAAMYALQGATDGRTQILAIEAALRSGSPYADAKASALYSALVQLYAASGRKEDSVMAQRKAEQAKREELAAKRKLKIHQDNLAERALEERRKKQRQHDEVLGAVAGAMMGAATGYADSGGSSVGAIAGAVGGAAVGSAGGNDAQYAYLEQRTAEETEKADASQRQLHRTLAQAERQSSGSPSGYSATGGHDRNGPAHSGSDQTSSYGNGVATDSSFEAGDAGKGQSRSTSATRMMYLVGQMPLIDTSGANPKCVSNVFNYSFTYDPDNPNSFDPAATKAAEVYFGRFIAKCNAAGKGTMTDEPSWVIDWQNEGMNTPRINPVDTVVTMP